MREGNNMPKYVLTLTSEQAREINKCLELLMRWKLKQPDIMAQMLLDISDDVDVYCRKRDTMVPKLKEAMDICTPEDPENCGKLKDREWHVAYNILQAIRYQIHLAEYPESKGVSSYPPLDTGGVGIPECSFLDEKRR